MKIPFSVDEVFELAEQMERNGQQFYRQASQKPELASHASLLKDLVVMEEDHEKTFASMRAELAKQPEATSAYDPDEQAAQYLHAFLTGIVFDLEADPTAQFEKQVSVRDVLRTAIGMERDSIAFYLGLKEMVDARIGQDQVDAIIKEEMGHIATLSQQLKALKA